jgi:ribosome-associated toxin RatA of RatAB toxin-antitoxin module
VPSARHEAEIDVTAAEVMAVILDFGAYTQFLPEIVECQVVRSGEGEWDVRFTVKVVKRLRYTLRLRQESPTQIRWHMLDGPFKVNDGGWDLRPLDEGRRVHVSYFIDLQVGMFVPSSIMRTLVERTLPETVHRFKQEAEARARITN